MEAETIDEIYTRKVGGEQYCYRLRYTPGAQVTWHADVFRDKDLKGSPEGVLTANTLAGSDLRQHLVTLVEVTIENMLGIAE